MSDGTTQIIVYKFETITTKYDFIMKKSSIISKALLTISLILTTCLSTLAHNFEVDGIYYNVIDEDNKKVEVTYEGSSFPDYTTEYSGSIEIPSSVTHSSTTYSVVSIGNYAFYKCSDLTSIIIPNSITTIGESAFEFCKNLTNITIPNTVTYIGKWALGSTAWYKNQPKGLIYINNVLYECNTTKPQESSISITDGTVSISPEAFIECEGLTSIHIPNSVTKIGPGAFAKCTNLAKVEISNSLKEIEDSVFEYCSSLTSISIPNSVTSIGDSAFIGCSGLTSIIIPNAVATIGHSAFKECTNITSATIGNAVVEINGFAFQGCSNLVTLNFNAEKCVHMGSYINPVFHYCNSLETINIGKSVTQIPYYAFYSCKQIKNLYIEDSPEVIYFGVNNTEPEFSNVGLFRHCQLENIYIGRNIFDYSTQPSFHTTLKSVTVGKFVTEFSQNIFEECRISNGEVNISDLSAWCKIKFGGLYANPLYALGTLKLNGSVVKNLIIPDDITEIHEFAFKGCNSLLSLTINNNITSINNYAFYDCDSLTSISISNSVKKIGGYAFDETTWLKNQLNGEIYINNVLYKYKGAIPTNDTIEIKDGTEYISPFAFSGRSGMRALTIPSSVTEIGYNAFYNCGERMLLITCYSELPPTCASGAFGGYSLSQCYPALLKVPEGSKTAYANATEWRRFTNIKEIAGVEDIEADNSAVEVIRYDIYGRILAEPTTGINIIKMSDGTTRKVIVR